jgi:CYTH domain-containing protein
VRPLSPRGLGLGAGSPVLLRDDAVRTARVVARALARVLTVRLAALAPDAADVRIDAGTRRAVRRLTRWLIVHRALLRGVGRRRLRRALARSDASGQLDHEALAGQLARFVTRLQRYRQRVDLDGGVVSPPYAAWAAERLRLAMAGEAQRGDAGPTCRIATVRDMVGCLREFMPRRRPLDDLLGWLDEAAQREVEIERKFLCRALPMIPADALIEEMEQGYLPGRRLIERLRIVRSQGRTTRFRTVKLGSGVQRVEVEERCPAALFRAMWPFTEGRRVRKRRHLVADGDAVWAIDEFTDRDLVLAEIELPSHDAVVEYPVWLAAVIIREVTDDATYVNAVLAR